MVVLVVLLGVTNLVTLAALLWSARRPAAHLNAIDLASTRGRWAGVAGSPRATRLRTA